MHGWIDGIASETLPMSVENVMSSSTASGRPRSCALRAVQVDELDVVLHLRVVGRDAFDVEPRAGRERARLEAVMHARQEVGQLDVGAGPGHPEPFGVRRDDVGCLPAVAHDTVDLLTGAEMLTQQPDRDLGDGERVAGVDAPLGRGGGVRFVTGVPNREV